MADIDKIAELITTGLIPADRIFEWNVLIVAVNERCRRERAECAVIAQKYGGDGGAIAALILEN